MKRLILSLMVILLLPAFSFAGSQWNNNHTEPLYNARNPVTKTSAYTATTSNDHIKVTASTANVTITLPAISSLSSGKSYKISKTDATKYHIVISPDSGGDTIDGTTAYRLTNQNDFILIAANVSETNWRVGYADDILDTNVATGVVTTGGDLTIAGTLTSSGTFTYTGAVTHLTETTTATDTLTASQCGTTIFLNSATEYLTTLPTPSAGCYFKIIVKAAPASASYTIATSASANILIGGVNELEVDTGDDGPYHATGDLITFVDGVAVVGDYIEMISDGTSWYLTGQTQADGGVTIGST